MSLHSANLQLEDQIAKLEGRPEQNRLAIAMIAVKKSVDDLMATYAADFQKMDKNIEDEVGLWQRLKDGAMAVALVLKEVSQGNMGDSGAGAWLAGNKQKIAALGELEAAQKKLGEAQIKLNEENEKDAEHTSDAWKVAAGAAAIAAGNVQTAADRAHEAVAAVKPDAHELLTALTKTAIDAKHEYLDLAEKIKTVGLETRKVSQEMANAAEREAEKDYKAEAAALEQSEKEKIAATKQGSQERIAAIDAALDEEASHGIQATNFYKSLLTQRIEAVKAEAAAEQKIIEEKH